MFNPDINIFLQQFSTGWLDRLMLFFTSFGEQEFYMAVIPILYWCVSRRWGHQLGFVFLGSMWLNGFLKDVMALPRPTEAQGVQLMVHEWSNGFPSGHAQGAVTLWGYLLLRVRSAGFREFCVFLIAMIIISRLYLGAHYLADVLGGLAIGIAVLALFMVGFARGWGQSWPKWLRVTLSIAVPLLLMPLNASSTTYMILGALIGLLVTDTFVLDGLAYKERAPLLKQVGKLIVGFAGFVILYITIKWWVPRGLPELIGFTLVGGWITVGAPLVFQKLGLAPRERLSPYIARVLRRFALAGVACVIVLVGASLAAQLLPSVPLFADGEIVEDRFTIRHQTPDGRPFAVIGHKGTAATAPEETMPSFLAAEEMGVDFLDVDLQLTKDHHLVALHDETVDATTDGQGPVNEMTLEEVKQLDAGYRMTMDGGATYPFRGQGITILTLDELLTAFPDSQFNIEMKPPLPLVGELTAETVQKHNAADRVIVGAFPDEALVAFRQEIPHTATMLSEKEIIRAVVFQHLGLGPYYVPPAQYAQVPETRGIFRVVTPSFVRFAHSRGLKVYVWTVNDKYDMERLMHMGVDGIITDDPQTLLEVVEPRSP